MTNVIDLSTLLGDVKVYERRVHGRKVKIDDLLFEDVPKFEQAITGGTFAGISEKARELLQASKIDGGFDEAWFLSMPFSEAMDLVSYVLYPELAGEPNAYEATPLRIKPDLEILLPPFTVADAVAYASHDMRKGISNMLLERFTTILDNATTLDGKPLPDGALSGLTRKQVDTLIYFYINRSVEREEGNVETPEPSKENETGTGLKPSSRSRARSRSTTSKKGAKATSANSD